MQCVFQGRHPPENQAALAICEKDARELRGILTIMNINPESGCEKGIAIKE